jgi:thiamine biosynthesis protein ThiS
MRIMLNDEVEEIADGARLSVLLASKGLAGKKGVVATVNGDVAGEDALDDKILCENDVVKIYSFVQGG